MSDETKRILNMVAEGKITADDAAKLLAKLGNDDQQLRCH